MKVLILGGTGEARELARILDARTEVDVVSSLAGRVAQPILPVGETRIGGFGGADGLATWLRDNDVGAVVDATHPFAAEISRNAAAAATELSIPIAVLRRDPWTPENGDEWIVVESLSAAVSVVRERSSRAFLTIGRQGVSAFADLCDTWFLVRSIDPPDDPLPPYRELLQERGPFDERHEVALMQQHCIDTVVTKNSGGPMTRAKIDAARALGLPVVMIDRPAAPPADLSTPSIDSVVRWLNRLV